MLEGERALGHGARQPGDAGGELRLAIRGDEAADRAPAPRRVTAGYQAARPPTLRNGGRNQVDGLEQAVHRVADLRRGEPGPPGTGAVGVLGGPHAGDALGVVAVRAALEERDAL